MSSQIFLIKIQESILFARNNLADVECCHEIIFAKKSSDESKVKVRNVKSFAFFPLISFIFQTDGGLEISWPVTADFIIQKVSDLEFGGDFGANENNVAVAVAWASKEATNYQLKPTDIVR